MLLKEVTFNYGIIEGTFLPGYMPNTGLLGMDRAWENPGWAFVFGSQNPTLRYTLGQNGNMAPSPELTQSFRQNKAINLSIKGLAEPIRDFRVTLEANKREIGDYSEIFRNSVDIPGNFQSLSPSRMGSYSISTILIGTTFAKSNDRNESSLFTDFENFRTIFKQRLDQQASAAGEYPINGQDVLIPSFLAAYRGQDPATANLNPFPKTPLPNWRVDYRGLSRLKGLSELFSSINLTHAYSSTYDVSNFSNSLQYQKGLELFNTLQRIQRPNLTNLEGQFIPIYILNQVVLTERYAPLIGVDVLTKQRMNIAVNYNRERNLGLNFSNSQITEQSSSDFGLTLSYTKAGVKIPFKIGGQQKILKNDLQMRLDTKVGNTQQVQRKIEEKATVTNGNFNFQFRPTLSYVINRSLNLTLYFERTVNDPRVTTAYRRSNTAFGGQLRFNLSQ
jgi:cell surface protein SprA